MLLQSHLNAIEKSPRKRDWDVFKKGLGGVKILE